MSKIIWVDDDINRPELRAERDELEERGCEIVPVRDADDFLEMLKKKKENFDYDGVIIVGSRTGLLLMKTIRENELFCNVKLIVYSIVDSDEVDKECKKYGALYLKKANLFSYEFADKVMEWVNGE